MPPTQKPLVRRAWSTLTIKSVDDEQRIIEGIASTPTTDRMGDIVEPMGAEYNLPLPLLWQHNSSMPVGEVFWAKPTKEGIPFKALLPKVLEPGLLQDRIEMAWQSLKYKLVKGVSIGFSEIETSQIKDSWSYHFIKWAWLELSCVTIPANEEATITSIKSADQALLAALGEKHAPVVRLTSTPGVTGHSTTPKGINTVKTIQEQIAAFEAKRAASVARMKAIMDEAAEKAETLSEDQTKEYDTLKAEVAAIDTHLVRLKEYEATMVTKAVAVSTAVTVAADPAAAGAAVRGAGGASGIVSVRANVEKGMGFTRYVKALAISKGNLTGALAIAQNNQRWKDTTPEVELVLRAAVAGGDTTSAGWAAELVYNQNLVSEFIEYLRPKTILGRIPNLTKVPFNVRMSGADQGTSASWVGQGKATPVSKMHTIAVTLGIAKAAGLVVLTNELVRSSDPSAELMVRNDLTAAIAQFLDQQFIAPDYAAVANVSPASMTSGVDPTPTTGADSAAMRTDVQTLFDNWITNNLDPTGGVWIMTPTQALAISLMLNAFGQPLYPNITMNGGEFFGLPVITSMSAKQVGSPVSGEGNLIVLLNAPEVLIADDGQVVIDASAEASLEMLDNPTNSAAAGTATSMVSMFQTNSTAIRATRFINWAKRRSFAAQYIKDAAYK